MAERARMQVERSLAGFRALVPGRLRRGRAIVALALGLALPAELMLLPLIWIDTWAAGAGMFLIFCNLLAWILVLGGVRSPAIEVTVDRPRLTVRVGQREQRCPVVGIEVSQGPGSIDIDPTQGAPLRVPGEGLEPADVDRLVALLREAAGGDAGSAAEVPRALRECSVHTRGGRT